MENEIEKHKKMIEDKCAVWRDSVSSSTMSVFQHAGSQSSPSFASLALTSSELPIVAMNTCRSGRLVSLCVTYSRRSMIHGRLFEHWLLAHIQQW